jgi:hypothetical protein
VRLPEDGLAIQAGPDAQVGCLVGDQSGVAEQGAGVVVGLQQLRYRQGSYSLILTAVVS